APQKKERRPGSLSATRTASSRVARLVDLANVRRREALRAARDFERHLITVAEALEAVALDRGVVDEYVLTLTLRDEAEALRLVEPLHGASNHWIPFPGRTPSDATAAPRSDGPGIGSEDARP